MVVSEQSRGKRPRTRLAGPYGHPIHPLLVTLPIGAWVASFIFDLVSLATHKPETWETGAYWLIGIGVLGALAAAVFGLIDLLSIPRRTVAMRTALWHLGLNLTVVALFVVSFLWRLGRGYDEQVMGSMVLLSAIALAALTVSGWLGGRLTYRYGVRVADEATQTQGFVAPETRRAA